MLGTYVSIWILVVTVGVTEGQDPEVNTQFGRIRGLRQQDAQGRSYDSFLGVPFGAPAEGSLRFAKPLDPEPWEDVLDTQEFSVHCVQIVTLLYPLLGLGGEQSEDCLYLNIWVPGEARPGRNLPVMVYYAGGGFYVATGEMYPGEALALQADAIVVNFNYRVAALGWLGTNDDVARGNWGHWDFQKALQWVQRNIVNFGGNPAQVTIFGESAGGSAVGHAMVSDAMRGLFVRGILQSSGLGGRLLRDAAGIREAAVALAEYFLCPTDTSQAIIDCLREEEAADVDLWGILVPIMEGLSTGWGPNVDGEFLRARPRDLFKAGAAAHLDFLAGRCFHDASPAVTGNLFGLNYTTNEGETRNSTDEFVRGYMSNYPDVDAAVAAVKQQYPDLNSDSERSRNLALAMMVTDASFGLSSHVGAEWHSGSSRGRSKTFLYEYQYRMSFFQYPEWVNGSHLDDIYSTLGEPFMRFFRETYFGQDWSDDDYRSFNNMATYWGNFAHNGDPSVGNPVPVVWPEYNNQTRRFARLTAYMSASSIEDEHPVYLPRYNFWRHEVDPPAEEEEKHMSSKPALDPDSITLQDAFEALDYFIADELHFPDLLYAMGEAQLKDMVQESYNRVRERRAQKRRMRE